MSKRTQIVCAAVCLLATLFISVGYAAISGSLNITGNATYREVPYEGVVITSVTELTKQNLTVNECVFSKPTNIQTAFTVNAANASVTFEITVTNNSDITYWYQGVSGWDGYGSNELLNKYNGITISTKDHNNAGSSSFDADDWIPPKTTRTFYATFSFGSNATGDISTMVKFDFGMRLTSVQDGVMEVLNDPTSYAFLSSAFNEAYEKYGLTVLGNVGEHKDIFDTLFGSDLTVTVDGEEKPVTIMIARENVDNDPSGDSYPNGPTGCEYTIYVTVDDLSSSGGQATVYAVTYVQGSDGKWSQLGQLYEGTSTIRDYNSDDEVYEGAFDVANWETVPNTTYTLFGNVQYTIVHSGGQDEFRCRTIEDLMTAKVNDFANYINSLQGTVTTISRVVYTYTKVGNEEIATPNQANESKSGYSALKAAFDKIKEKNLLLINNGGSTQFQSNVAREMTRAELISLLVELDTAYSYYLEAN